MKKNISHKQFFDVIDSVERLLDRDDWKVSDVDIWPIIKIYYSYFVLTQLIDNRDSQIQKFQGKISKGLRGFEIFRKSLCARFVDKSNNEKLRKTDILIFVQSSTRYFKNLGFWYSPYSDTLQAGLASKGLDSVVCETTEDAKFLFPRFGRSLLIQRKLILNMIIAKAKSMIFPTKLKGCTNWDRFSKIIEEELGPEFRPNSSKINFHINNLFQQLPFFSKLLESTDCKVCVMSGYYSSTMFALIKACRAIGVKTVEIQHGVQGDAHLAYRSWYNLPTDHTNIMPDYFWTWSIREKEIIDNWADSTAGRHKAFVGGNPCLTIYNKKGENIVTKNEFKGYEFPSGKVSKVILFTCQAFENLSEAVIKSIQIRPDFGWVFRIHPQYWQTEKSIRAQCENEGLKNIVIDKGELLPLSSALLCSTVHMTEFSSSVIEAAAVGLHSIIIHPYGRELYADLIEVGAASYIDGYDDILKKIDSISSSIKSDFALANEKAFIEGVSEIMSLVRRTEYSK